MAALALRDEHSTLARMQIREPQPKNLAAARPVKQHRFDHRPVPVGAQRIEQRVDLIGGQDPRQRARHPHQRRRVPGTTLPAVRQTPRTGFAVTPTSPPANRYT